MIEEIKSIPKTFGNRAFYRDLVYGDEGIGMGFILILAILGIIGAGARQGLTIFEEARNLQAAMNVMPDGKVTQDKLTLDVENPWSAAIAPRPSGDSDVEVPYKVVVDTDFNFADHDEAIARMDRDHALIFITGSKIVSRTGPGRDIEINNLSSFPMGAATHEKWVDAGESMMNWAYVVTIFGGSFGIGILMFLAVVAGAALMKIWAFLVASELEFSDAMRLVAAAGIPMAIVSVFWLPSFGLRPIGWIAWSIFGLWLANRPEKENGR